MSRAATDRDVDAVRLGLQGLQRLLSARRPWTALAEAAGVELSQQEIQVLQVLRDGRARSMAELARDAHMDAGAVSRQVAALEARGLATRRSSPTHGRVVLVEPTDEGRTVARRLHARRDGHLVDVLASWAPEDRESLGRLLVRLVDDLQRTPYRR